jgi:hypothetical protein
MQTGKFLQQQTQSVFAFRAQLVLRQIQGAEAASIMENRVQFAKKHESNAVPAEVKRPKRLIDLQLPTDAGAGIITDPVAGQYESCQLAERPIEPEEVHCTLRPEAVGCEIQNSQ